MLQMHYNQFEVAAGGLGLQGAVAGQILDLLASKCAGLPLIVWLIIGLVSVAVALRVRTLRIVYKGERREFTLETNNGKDRKPDSQQKIEPNGAPRAKGE
ncbi:MAG TPA: hypothetical protein VGY56_21725 [Verrucomicrobiae bacterium]|nr:hypothetical protein [Verrucomicrobiae bacterium]